MSEDVANGPGPIPRGRADRRRLVWMLLRRGDIGAALLDESRHVGEREPPGEPADDDMSV